LILFNDEQKEVLHSKFKEFQEWAKSDENSKMILDHKEKAEQFRQKFSKENISKITEDEYKKCWADSFAGGIISTVGQDKWWKKNIIEKNKGFENVKQKTNELLYGSDELPKRFENGIKNIVGFADSTITEFLNNIYPEKCPIWNKRVRTAISNIGFSDIVPTNLKDTISKASEYNECVDFLTDFKNELSQYNVKDFYDLDHFFWHFSTSTKKLTSKEKTNFYFVEKDFASTTGKKTDAQYLHKRFKELVAILNNNLDPKYDITLLYSSHPFNRGSGKWLNHSWLGVPLKGTDKKNVKGSIQFQVSLTNDDPLTFMIYLDNKARTKKKQVKELISQKKEEFQERLDKLPINYVVGFKKDKDSEWVEVETSRVTPADVDSILEALSERNSEFSVHKYVSAAEAIARKSLIVDDIVESSKELLPLCGFLEGKDVAASMEPDSSFLLSNKYQKFNQILLNKKQIIFYGPPGTGKTYTALKFAKKFVFEKMSDDQFIKAVIEQIKSYAKLHKYNLVKEDDSENLYSLKNPNKEIRLGLHFSGSEKRDSEKPFIGVPNKMVNFLNQVPEENRFEVIINNSVKNYVVLPESIKKQYAKFSDSSTGKWDPSGKGQHSYHISITEDSASLQTPEQIPEKKYDCTRFLRNLETLNLSEKPEPSGYIRVVTFHPSYSYEEFVEGIKANIDDGKLVYEVEDGSFKKICKDAQNDPNRNYVLIIDEINRGNISKIFGELISLIENDKREKLHVNLAYSKKRFAISEAVTIFGSSNSSFCHFFQDDLSGL